MDCSNFSWMDWQSPTGSYWNWQKENLNIGNRGLNLHVYPNIWRRVNTVQTLLKQRELAFKFRDSAAQTYFLFIFKNPHLATCLEKKNMLYRRCVNILNGSFNRENFQFKNASLHSILTAKVHRALVCICW